jgi:Protein of unknown function (DUF3592)
MAADDVLDVVVRGPLLGLLVTSPVLAPGLVVWWFRTVRANRITADAQARWRRTSGTVVVSLLRTASARRVSRNSVDDVPVSMIQYTYQVEGRDYRGSRVTLLRLRRNDSQAHHDAADRYRQGHEVTVYYDPDRPRRSALRLSAPSPDPNVLAWLHLLAVASMVTGTLVVLAYRLAQT